MSFVRSVLRVSQSVRVLQYRTLRASQQHLESEPDKKLSQQVTKSDVSQKEAVKKTSFIDSVVGPAVKEEVEKQEVPYETDNRERWAEQHNANTNAKEIIAADITWFGDQGPRDKETFLDKCENFQRTVTKHRHGQVEFIYAALRHMKDFGVHKDLQAYKGLMDVFPKDVMVPTNIFQGMFWHFYKQQECAIQILHQMELRGVEPDHEIERMVIDIFGQRSLVWRKVARQLYWQSKFRNANPYPVPENIDNLDALELARLALQRMCPDLQTKITVYSTTQVEDSVDKTWIVSAQSPTQRELINEIFSDQPLYVDGPHTVWLKEHQITFFMLRADNRVKDNPDASDEDPLDVTNIPIHPHGQSKEGALMKQKNIHTQEDGTVLSLAATGTSSRDSLLSWVRLLQTTNPKLEHLQVIFTLKAPNFQVQSFQQQTQSKSSSENHHQESQ